MRPSVFRSLLDQVHAARDTHEVAQSPAIERQQLPGQIEDRADRWLHGGYIAYFDWYCATIFIAK